MSLVSVNPATGEEIARYDHMDSGTISAAVSAAAEAQSAWSRTPVAERADLLQQLSDTLLDRKEELAEVITREMGKLSREAISEIEKCAWVCRYYADNAEPFLADQAVDSDASRSLVVRQPLGLVLAIMPWNFPFWQAFRCAVPALAAGNGMLLKHASNVTGCALAIEEVFAAAGFPGQLFRTLVIDPDPVAGLLENPRIAGVSLTGSDRAGRAVASNAGEQLKKCVLELGGSDPFIVLRDANLDAAVKAAATSRFLNCGQSCIAAKRFLVAKECADEFTERFIEAAVALVPGDPSQEETGLAPMARGDLRDDLHEQVQQTITAGGRLLTGGHVVDNQGYFYAPTLVDRVPEDSPMARDEVFGPAGAILAFEDEADALRIANASRFGLGASVWSTDLERAERLARGLEAGCVFVNDFVKSDPRLPFGGVKDSGFGRELSRLGIEEFTNAKTLVVA